MEFVYMEHPKLQNGARFPETAVPHWESYGWQRTNPPEKPRPQPIVATAVTEEPDAPSASALMDAEEPREPKAAGKTNLTTSTTQKAPRGRKED